jgi:cell division protein FtsL
MLTTRTNYKGEITSSSSRNVLPVGYNDSKGYHLHAQKNEKSPCKQIWTVLLYIITAALFFQVGYLFMQYSATDVRNESQTRTTANTNEEYHKGLKNSIQNVGISTAKINEGHSLDSLSNSIKDATKSNIADATKSNIVNNGMNQGTRIVLSLFKCFSIIGLLTFRKSTKSFIN